MFQLLQLAVEGTENIFVCYWSDVVFDEIVAKGIKNAIAVECDAENSNLIKISHCNTAAKIRATTTAASSVHYKIVATLDYTD